MGWMERGVRWWAAAGVALVLGPAVTAAEQSPGQRRVALVIGNAAYEARGASLTNPLRDANGMAAVLRDLDFDVVRATDATKAEMVRATNTFVESVRPGDVAVFYYAGHGMELEDGVNYLAPVEFSADWDEVDAEHGSLPVNWVQDKMERSGAAVRIVILDACRNNPFERMRTLTRGGLGGMEARGGLVAYAAAAGELADDDPGSENGLFTKHLLAALREPGLRVRDLFTRVRTAVHEESNGDQVPALYDGLVGDFVFRSAPGRLTPNRPDPAPSRRRAGDVFRDCSSCPEMVVIPAGTFTMGSPASEEGRRDSEGPQHRVTLRSFALGATEVTFDEWDACVRGGGCGGYRPGDAGWGRDARPVINVNWDDARAYVRWLSRETGESYRLPSESEWEYAARAGTTTPFHTGRTISKGQANYDRGQTTPVRTFAPNAFGLYDVHGNVWEWTEDCWNGSYRGAPADGSPWGAGDCGRRVFRGGSWHYVPRLLRSAARSSYFTGFRFDSAGFRVARTLD